MGFFFGFLFGLVCWIFIIAFVRHIWKNRKVFANLSKEDKDEMKKQALKSIKDGIKIIARHPFLFK